MMDMQAPRFEFQWNLGSVMSLITLISVVAGGGYAYSQMVERSQTQADRMNRMDMRVTTVEQLVPSVAERTGNIEYRVGRLESSLSESTQVVRQLEGTLNNLATDMRVTREILERLERQNNGGTSSGSR